MPLLFKYKHINIRYIDFSQQLHDFNMNLKFSIIKQSIVQL